MEKRVDPRKDFIARAQIQFENDLGEVKQASVLVEDRSRSGMRLSVKETLKRGSAVTITAPFGTFEGVVMRCIRSEGGGYQVGVKFREPSNPATPKPPAPE